MDHSAERPLAELLSEVASHTPAPGGGSAAAWAGALGAALVEMAAAYAGDDEAASRARALRADLLAAGDQELHSYEPVLAATRAPAGDPGRELRLAAALSEASRAPLAIARASTEAAELGAAVASRSKPTLRGDAIAGVLLAEAATQTASALVRINLGEGEGDPRLVEIESLMGRAGAARDRVGGRG